MCRGHRPGFFAHHLAGETEVQHLHVPVGPQHHVFRFDIAMHDSAGMGRGQRARYLGRDVDGVPHGDRGAVDPLTEGLPFDELGDDERPTVEITKIVDNQNMRMVE